MVLSWAIAALTAVVSLAITPILVHRLEREAYGVWTFLNGLTLYSNLLYVGLGAAFMKRLSEAAGRGDDVAGSRLFGVALTVYACLGLLCLSLALILRPFVPHMFAQPLSPGLESVTSITIALLGVRLALMFMSSAFTALLTAHGRWDLGCLVTIVLTLVRTGGVLWASAQPTPLPLLAGVTVLDAALQVPLFALMGRAVAPGIRFRPQTPTREELRGLYGFGIQAFVVQIAVLVISYTDTALIGVVLGAGAVGIYSLPLQLIEHSRILVAGVTQNLLPELSARRARGEMDQVSDMFLLASRACATLSAFVNVHLVLLGPAFLALWVGPEIAAESPNILLCLGIAATAAALSTQAMTPVYMALDLVRVLLVIVIAEAAVNFALSYWLAHVVGLWGVALATAIPAVAITLFFAPRALLTRLQIPVAHFVGYVFGPATLLTVGSLATQLLLARWHTVTSFFDLAFRVAASTAVCLGIVLATFDRADLPGPLRRFSWR
ncbi:MAG: oligosaccharide flippase family protein [Vicinamibacterales bacterium]